MNSETSEQYNKRLEDAINLLVNWVHLGDFLFLKGGKIYDLSAADLSQIERIERDGLFVVAE